MGPHVPILGNEMYILADTLRHQQVVDRIAMVAGNAASGYP